MHINSVESSFSSSGTASLLTALQGTGLSVNTSGSSTTGVADAGSDSSQLSPFAQLLSTLQQMQQSNPTQYQQVTQQIATNLQTAAQTATANGNTAQASQLTQLAKDFTTASTSGQLPNIQDLAQAIGGRGHNHHHHSHSESSYSSPDSSNSAQNNSLNPMSIIMNTLSQTGSTVPTSS